MSTQVQVKPEVYRPWLGALFGALAGYVVAELIIAGIYEYEDSLVDDEDEEEDNKEEEDFSNVVVKSKTKAVKKKEVDYQKYFKNEKKPKLEELTKKIEKVEKNGDHLKVLGLADLNELNPEAFEKKVSLRYYKSVDTAVNNEDDAVVLDLDEMVGRESLSMFGHDGHGANELYVLDTELKILYEIRKTFEHEVFSDDPDELEAMRGGSGIHRNRIEDWDDENEDDEEEEEN
jgi:hypothetical protein